VSQINFLNVWILNPTPIPIQYIIQNHSLGSNFQSRYLKPIAIQYLTHDQAETNYVTNMVSLHFQENYSVNTTAVSFFSIGFELLEQILFFQLCKAWVNMMVDGTKPPILHPTLWPLVSHIQAHKNDFLCVLDGHSDYLSGEIIYGRNKCGDDVSDGVDGVSFLLSFFLFFFQRMLKQ
jgi:hypothetical protein